VREQDIRLLHALREMEDAVDLQRSYWGTRPEAVLPGHMPFTTAQHGSHVLGAFEGATAHLVAIAVAITGLFPVASRMSSP